MKESRFPKIIQEIYKLVKELEEMSETKGRKFTPDGHLVGSIGEALAAYYYGLTLCNNSNKGFDALFGELEVEIKATQGNSIALRSKPQHLLVLKIGELGTFQEIYNGPGDLVWLKIKDKPLPKNGQYKVGVGFLKSLMAQVPLESKLIRIKVDTNSQC